MALVTGTAATIGALAKLKAILAGLGKAKAVASAAGAAKTATAGATKIAGTTAARKAGSNWFTKALLEGFAPDPTRGITRQVVDRVGLDAALGAWQGINTPGDIGDKVIAGTTSAVGGALGGGLTSGLTRNKLGGYGEIGGGIAGDMLAQNVGDTLLRGKDKLGGGEGLTPWEKMSKEQQEQFAQQIRNDTLLEMGLGNSFSTRDQYLAELGLG